jgi:hypothetical protein
VSEREKEDDPFEGLVLDDDFVRGAEKAEGSARARMLAARWRENPPEQTGFRESTDNVVPLKKQKKPRKPFFQRRRDPWGRPVRKDRANLKIAVWFVLVAVLLMVASNQGYFRNLLGSSNDDDATTSSAPMTAEPQVSGVASAAPTQGTDPIDPNTPTRDHPFAGSPAIDYRDNDAGIALPDAKAVGDYSVDTVRTALQNTRKLLIEGNLDRAVVMGGVTQPYLDLLDPQGKDSAALRKAIASPDPKGTTALDWITRFDPKEIELVGTVVKVDGVMSYSVDKDGILNIHSDFSFVYPVAKVGDPNGEVTRTVMRRVIDAQVIGRHTAYTPTQPGKLFLYNVEYDPFNTSCDRLDGYVRPYFPSDDSGTKGSGAPVDPYDRSKSLPSDTPSPGSSAEPDCGTISRI